MNIKPDIKFYDTSSLLIKLDNLFKEPFVISSISLAELENIKTSSHKDYSLKMKARRLLNLLNLYEDSYTVWIFKSSMLDPIIEKDIPITDDMKILATALDYDKNVRPDETIFVTNDIALKNIANLFFGNDSIESVKEEEDLYKGYKEVIPTEFELSEFYKNKNYNHFNLLTNEYVIIKNDNNTVIDVYCWDGTTHRYLNCDDFSSVQFGRTKPYKGDIHQKLLFDSLYNNKLTLIGGPPGSGKSAVALAFLFDRLEKGIIDRIIIFCNPVAAKDAAKLGFYPGDRVQKLIDSQVGGILSSKLGSTDQVMRYIEQEKIVLMPAADARGYETPPNSGVYIMEAQNLDITLMKMLIQRIGENCITVIDGDNARQIDLDAYAGENNGIKRVSEVFRGQKYFGQVNLVQVHRSEIADRAEQM